MTRRLKIATACFWLFGQGVAWAEPPQVVEAHAALHGEIWTFEVTLRHPDTGWDHYADGWRIVAPDGTVLGTRELLHPHETEQPFTRSLSGIRIPAGIQSVMIVAKCSRDGWNTSGLSLQLPVE